MADHTMERFAGAWLSKWGIFMTCVIVFFIFWATGGLVYITYYVEEGSSLPLTWDIVFEGMREPISVLFGFLISIIMALSLSTIRKDYIKRK